MVMAAVDRRSEAVRRMVTLGESTTAGASASSVEVCWASVVGRILGDCQGQPLQLINKGLGSNVLTPRCPAYEQASKPSGIERLARDVLDLRPDLVVLAYGLNDARGGTLPEVFRGEYQGVLDRVRLALPGALVVLVGVHHVHEAILSHCPGWEWADRGRIEQFDGIVRELAEANGLIFADVYAAMGRADWLIDPDGCHPNDLGHRVMAHCVFNAIAAGCGFASRTARRP
jgi:lysophospholipase L1-like esterase